MVEALLHPLNIFLFGLGGSFLIPLLYRIAKPLPAVIFVLALAGIVAVSAACLWAVYHGQPVLESFTAGSAPPYSINLRVGPWEGVCAFSVNIVALLAAWHLWDRLRQNYAAQLLFLLLIMGVNGMVMTRDLFNLFVFLEIVSIATYGLLGFDGTPAALAAGFKYILATVLASTFFLLGTALLYHVTGTLNIDDMIVHRAHDSRTDRNNGVAARIVLPHHRTEALSGQRLGAGCLSIRLERCCSTRFRGSVGGRILCALQTASAVRKLPYPYRSVRRDNVPVLQSCRICARRTFSACLAIRRSRKWGFSPWRLR